MRALGRLMDRNFELRRALFGDEVVGRGNLGMVQVRALALRLLFQARTGGGR